MLSFWYVKSKRQKPKHNELTAYIFMPGNPPVTPFFSGRSWLWQCSSQHASFPGSDWAWLPSGLSAEQLRNCGCLCTHVPPAVSARAAQQWHPDPGSVPVGRWGLRRSSPGYRPGGGCPAGAHYNHWWVRITCLLVVLCWCGGKKRGPRLEPCGTPQHFLSLSIRWTSYDLFFLFSPPQFCSGLWALAANQGLSLSGGCRSTMMMMTTTPCWSKPTVSQTGLEPHIYQEQTTMQPKTRM